MITHSDITLLEQNLSFWEHLSSSEKEFLIAHTNVFHYNRGTIMHAGKMDCIGILMIKSGVLRASLISEEGREVTLYRLNADQVCVLSASCVLQSITFDVLIAAETDCDIVQISSNAFAKISRNNVYAELFSYKTATERFSDVMWTMQQVLFMRFDQRLATFLIQEATKNHSNTLYMTHEQIAKYIGSAREVVSRMLKYFSNEGYINLSRGTIHIIQQEKLLTLAEHDTK